MKIVWPIVKRSSAGKLCPWSETEVMTVFVTGAMNETTPTLASRCYTELLTNFFVSFFFLFFFSYSFIFSKEAETTYLKYGRLDALANLVPDINVSRHFGQDIGPEGWLLRSSPAEGWRVPGCVLQLHATQQNMSAGCFLNRPPRDCSPVWTRRAHWKMDHAHTAGARALRRLSDGRNYFRTGGGLI